MKSGFLFIIIEEISPKLIRLTEQEIKDIRLLERLSGEILFWYRFDYSDFSMEDAMVDYVQRKHIALLKKMESDMFDFSKSIPSKGRTFQGLYPISEKKNNHERNNND
jgi:hypothetical protein